jgi:DNA recombination protein RmuC
MAMELGIGALIVVLAVMAGAAMAIFMGRISAKRAPSAGEGAGESVMADLARLQERAAAAQQMEKELRERMTRAENVIAERDSELGRTRGHLAAKEQELAVAAEREKSLNAQIAERDEQVKGLHKTLKTEFENIAHAILKSTTEELSGKSQESLAAVLDPLKARIVEFQQKVETTHTEDTKQRSALSEQIKQVAQTNQSVGSQAEALSKALKGDSQLRGRWGEVRLERILENSGLARGREFVVQGGDFNIKAEDGGSQRPDIVIILPENRHFVIDSKLSLVDYLDYESAETEAARAAALKKLLASCRAHIDNLAGKNYQHAGAINSHEMVFLFMPIEGVAALVLQNDDRLFDYAWSRKIVIASPSTLFMSMQTVNSIWRYERQSQNAQEIALQAGRLYDKLVGFVEDLKDVSEKLDKASAAHGSAMKKLYSGKGNALASAQKLKALGAASKKHLPAMVIDGDVYAPQDEDDDPDLPSNVVALPAPRE